MLQLENCVPGHRNVLADTEKILWEIWIRYGRYS